MTTLEKIKADCDLINEQTSELSYVKHREVQEALCEIVKQVEGILQKRKGKKND